MLISVCNFSKIIQALKSKMNWKIAVVLHFFCMILFTLVCGTVHSVYDVNPNGFVWDFDGSEWGLIKHQSSNSIIRMS